MDAKQMLWGRIRGSYYDCQINPRAHLAQHNEERAYLYAEFKANVLAAAGLTEHPKAEAAFAMAYAYGHPDGWAAIAHMLEDLAELLLT